MQDDPAQHFSSHAEFEAHFRTSLARSHLRLDLFDPDFSVWPLGVSDVDAALRHFLSGGGQMRLVMHKSDHVRQHYPRFMRSLKDFSHVSMMFPQV